MNALNREIKEGERVVMSSEAYNDPTGVFVCKTGYGMKPYLMGASIQGHWESDNEEDAVSGVWIDVEKTNALTQQENAS